MEKETKYVYNCTLSDYLSQKAEKELNEKENWRNRDIQALREMVIANKALNCPLDSPFLLRFLRAKKFDYDRAYQTIINYYSIRRANSLIIKELLPSKIMHVLESGVTTLLPSTDKHGRKIFYFRPAKWDPSKFPMIDILRANIISLELAIKEEETQVNGIVVIGNMSGLSLRHVSHFDRNYARLMNSLVQESFPLRFKGIHFVHEPIFFGFMFSLFQPFLKKKIASRLKFHGSKLEELVNEFGRDALPLELGGSLPEGDILAKLWKENLMQNEEMFQERLQYGLYDLEHESSSVDAENSGFIPDNSLFDCGYTNSSSV